MLVIKNLCAKTEEKNILLGINLSIQPGEIHVIMGPNGSGKSTLANVLAGHPDYQITDGFIEFEHENINALSPEERAHKGLFLSFQYPVEIPGVNNMYFMRSAMNSILTARGQEEIDPIDFMTLIRKKAEILSMDETFLHRSVNEGFSGGEKKRNEILQMLMLEPKLAILDEIDSGLDVDALQMISNGINAFKNQNRSIILVTHYQRLLNYVTPDYVHILQNGKIVKSGNKELAVEIENNGYGLLENV